MRCGINPHTWVVSPWCALLAGCRCLPLFGDDMPHDALMWGHGGKHARNPRSCAWAVHFPWGQPPYKMENRGGLIYGLRVIRKHFLCMSFKFFPDFVCADITCPDVPNFLCFHDIVKVSYPMLQGLICVCLTMTYSTSSCSCCYHQDIIVILLCFWYYTWVR